MSTTIAELQQLSRRRAASNSVFAWIALLAGLSIVVGAVAGVLWASAVTLPNWQIDEATSIAVMSERGVTTVAGADVLFVIIGACVSLGLGLVSWRWFRALGWPVALIAVGAGLLAGLICWQTGQLFGPGSEAERIAAAAPGAVVTAALKLRSLSALAVWGFAAVTPVLLISSLGRDEDEPPPKKSKRSRAKEVEQQPAAAAEQLTVDERGVLTDSEDQE